MSFIGVGEIVGSVHVTNAWLTGLMRGLGTAAPRCVHGALRLALHAMRDRRFLLTPRPIAAADAFSRVPS
jgi:hypothetical protein